MRKCSLIGLVILTLATFASAQQLTLPLWPNGSPEAIQVSGPERDTTTAKDQLVAGGRVARLTDVSEPTITLYQPAREKNSGAAVLVFPGGGYHILAYDLEGTEVCAWLNRIGITGVLVKYRVPVNGHYPENVASLEDAQQAMRLTRLHAAEWHIDPQRVGVLGFSAGGHLAATIGTHADYKRDGIVGKQQVNARPNFVVLIYPAYLVESSDLMKLTPSTRPDASTPPTFLVQAEDDPVHEENALFYYQGLKEAGVPAELHLFSNGGHGYGLRPTELPVTRWPEYAEKWFHTIGVLGKSEAAAATGK